MTVLRRMLLVAVIIGTSVTVTATERVDAWLVLAGTAGWSFVPVLQLATGLFLLRGSRIPRSEALGQYFATHWPWSLWILAVHAILLAVPWFRSHAFWLTLTAVVPVALTVRLLRTLSQHALAVDRRAARRRVAEHQVLTLALVLVYVELAVALWPRIVGVLW